MSNLQNDKIMDNILDHIDIVLGDEKIDDAIQVEIGEHEDYYGDNHDEIQERVGDWLIDEMWANCDVSLNSQEEVKELAYKVLHIK